MKLSTPISPAQDGRPSSQPIRCCTLVTWLCADWRSASSIFCLCLLSPGCGAGAAFAALFLLHAGADCSKLAWKVIRKRPMSKARKFPAFATDFFLARRLGGPNAGHLCVSEGNFHLNSGFLGVSEPAGCSVSAVRVCVECNPRPALAKTLFHEVSEKCTLCKSKKKKKKEEMISLGTGRLWPIPLLCNSCSSEAAALLRQTQCDESKQAWGYLSLCGFDPSSADPDGSRCLFFHQWQHLTHRGSSLRRDAPRSPWRAEHVHS